MDAIFGDTTTSTVTPARADGGSLMSVNSPMNLRAGVLTSNGNVLGSFNVIPASDIDPPMVLIKNGKPQYSNSNETGRGLRGWISRMIYRIKGEGGNISSGKYRQLDREDD
jgi:hypothetical protein